MTIDLVHLPAVPLPRIIHLAEAVRRQDPVEAARAMVAHIRLVSDVALLRENG